MIQKKAQGCAVLLGVSVLILAVVTWAVSLAYFYSKGGLIGDIVFGSGVVIVSGLIFTMAVRQAIKAKNESNIYPDENGRLPTIQRRPWWSLGIFGEPTFIDLNLVAHEYSLGRTLSSDEMRMVGLNVLANSRGGTQPGSVLKDMIAKEDNSPPFLALPDETQRGTPLLIEARDEMQAHYER